MVGITLTPEQIRTAPPAVRQWLEREIASSLGFQPELAPPEHEAVHLVACGPEEALAIYGAIRGMLPVANVFFELGREGESIGQQGIEAYRLTDMLRHTRLPGMEQLAACLQLINEAVRALRKDPNATLYTIDPRGYCMIAAATQRSILRVWQQIVAGGAPQNAFVPAAAQKPAAPVYTFVPAQPEAAPNGSAGFERPGFERPGFERPAPAPAGADQPAAPPPMDGAA